MSQKKEEISNLLVAVAFDTSLKKLNEKLESRNIEITPGSITIVIKICMEIAEATRLKGKEQKVLVERLVKKVVKDAPISDEKEKLLLDMIEEGVVGDVIDLVVSATKGELDINAVEKAAVGCCLALLKSRKRNDKI
jgi:hypothetical protein|tara:strand:- start:1055 stop:1465 length:411 start_codon:yes stop_codon:yes gene_type:complete